MSVDHSLATSSSFNISPTFPLHNSQNRAADRISSSRLHAGHVPRLLHVNHEARLEGLRTYTLISSHVPYVTSKPLPRLSNNKTRKIYINLERDTIYLTNYHTTTGLLKWLSRLGMEEVGGAGTGVLKKPSNAADGDSDGKQDMDPHSEERIEPLEKAKKKYLGKGMFKVEDKPPPAPGPGIRHLAFPASMIFTLALQNRLDFFLSLAMQQPRLRTLGIILHPKKFELDPEPGKYYLEPPKAVPADQRGCKIGDNGDICMYRCQIEDLFRDFWRRERKPGDRWETAWHMLHGLSKRQGSELLASWEKWIETRPEWDGPQFLLWDLKKSNKLVL